MGAVRAYAKNFNILGEPLIGVNYPNRGHIYTIYFCLDIIVSSHQIDHGRLEGYKCKVAYMIFPIKNLGHFVGHCLGSYEDEKRGG